MNLEELFVEKYKELEDKVESLEKQLNEKNKIILEFACMEEDIRKDMWVDKNNCGDKYLCFFGTPCLFEKHDKKEFDKIVRFFGLKVKENE